MRILGWKNVSISPRLCAYSLPSLLYPFLILPFSLLSLTLCKAVLPLFTPSICLYILIFISRFVRYDNVIATTQRRHHPRPFEASSAQLFEVHTPLYNLTILTGYLIQKSDEKIIPTLNRKMDLLMLKFTKTSAFSDRLPPCS